MQHQLYFLAIQIGVADPALILIVTIILGGQLILDAGATLGMFKLRTDMIVAVSQYLFHYISFYV